MLFLALECSTARGSVALFRGDDFAHCGHHWRATFTAGRGHGGELFTTLQKAMEEGEKTGDRLGEIIVGLGPGSYSGVRQAIAAATGLALATGARLFGRPSTAAVPVGVTHPCHVIGDARRGTFYYTAVQDGLCLVGPELLPDIAALQARVDEHPEWFGVAVEAVPAGLPPELEVVWPNANWLFLGSAAGLIPPPLEPIYLRPVAFTLPRPDLFKR